MILCQKCKFDGNPNDAMYCIECGKKLEQPYTGITQRITLPNTYLPGPSITCSGAPVELEYYCTHAELNKLIKESPFSVMFVPFNGTFLYHGKKVILID